MLNKHLVTITSSFEGVINTGFRSKLWLLICFQYIRLFRNFGHWTDFFICHQSCDWFDNVVQFLLFLQSLHLWLPTTSHLFSNVFLPFTSKFYRFLKSLPITASSVIEVIQCSTNPSRFLITVLHKLLTSFIISEICSFITLSTHFILVSSHKTKF